MAILYRNAKGYEVTRHSYSAGAEFSFCKRKYQLSRIKGWKEKERRASAEFGSTVEAAIQSFHVLDMKPHSGVKEFERLWTKFQQVPDLVYTDKEGSWEALMEMGKQMLQLYEVSLPKLPIKQPKFQLNFQKEVFPGHTDLGGIDYTAFIDMLSTRDDGTKLVIDIKTSGVSLPEDNNLLMLDPQLRSYAWVTGVPEVGFLWFMKASPAMKRGDKITLLTHYGMYDAGDQVIVLKVMDEAVAFVTAEVYEVFQKAHAGLRGKAADAVVEEFIDVIEGILPKKLVTKVRLQFRVITIPPDDVYEAGQAIGQEIAEIHNASATDSFPKEPGIRFPNNKCMMCQMLGICTRNDALRDEKLVNIAPTQMKDWLDEMETGE